jgi:L-2-hydroxyglutarate oxidase
MQHTSDFTIIGGGVIGLTIALELRRLFADAGITLIEKEAACGEHASGRNSGVLHAGFYYPADSLKAQFTRLGNERMKDYCARKGIHVNRCGKLVVAKNEGEWKGLEELLRRGAANGVELAEITEEEARKIEPRVRTCGKAIYSPSTATVDPAEVMRALVEDAAAAGIRLLTGCRYLGRTGSDIRTSIGVIAPGYVINAAGLYADRIAADYGFGEDYRILPFKGLYLYSSEQAGAFRTNLYPVPDLRNPFLGVHVTLTAHGRVKIGPTAIPCLWREQYGWRERFSAREFAGIMAAMAGLFLRRSSDFRSLALQEVRKYYRPYMIKQAQALATGVRAADYRRWGRPGIRAQLLHKRDRKLVMDFCIQGDEKSLHVLNAVSPAFTCSFPFAEHVCRQIISCRDAF